MPLLRASVKIPFRARGRSRAPYEWLERYLVAKPL